VLERFKRLCIAQRLLRWAPVSGRKQIEWWLRKTIDEAESSSGCLANTELGK
jgi:hypothetical protein